MAANSTLVEGVSASDFESMIDRAMSRRLGEMEAKLTRLQDLVRHARRVITLQEAAQYYFNGTVKKRQLLRMAKDGAFKVTQVGRTFFVDTDDLQAFLSGGGE